MKKWRHFEDILGRLVYEDLGKNKNDITGEDIHRAFIHLRDYLKEWIEAVDLSKAKVIDGFPQKRDALFLSFNYTLTHENVYHVFADNICHIHGMNGEDELIFGHKDLKEKMNGNKTDADRQVAIVREIFWKDTEECYNQYIDFFNKINADIKEVISIGFSYSDADIYYIKKIIKQVGNNTTWYLYNHQFTTL